ncbi:MAG TPA: penicillin-binding protein [Syntrophales bacterium]|jgi:cell division protein FtsI (penicillin-binding protein 3)|nr:penicillin-binding protein [Syntrophales bacterium]HOU77388.1 penicillin-binding protein [Syntrophales bacterium]HPC32490.1 penicillin-binding protein [Syntrophales bacterium]HQJ29769.1 penicillin-binding protein [Syntrophales bacterium]HRR46995.1 penicillin-binding protein [Syntrophales bacterium]
MMREEKKWLRFRITTLLALFLVLFVALFTRAFQLQILSGRALKTMAAKQHLQTLEIPPERGIIFDRNGEKLAASALVDSVCADPSKFRNPREVLDKVSVILSLDRDALEKKITGARNFCWLARRVSPEQAKKVENLRLEGVFLVKEPKRFYPNGELAGHLLGFVGLDSTGLEGLELKYNNFLQGAPEKLVLVRDAKGKKMHAEPEKPAGEGKSSYHLILTIDSRIQHLVEGQLKEAVRDKGAKGGYAIVMDPRTGEILALANQPSFDPNFYTQGGSSPGKNCAITDVYDPGSTFKPFLVAAALEEKVVKETDRIFCENGHYSVSGKVIHEAQRKRHGVLTVREIIKYSSNIGSAKIAERLGKEKFYHYISRFGFGSKTGIDLNGESTGILRNHQNWTRVDLTRIAFGQGISVTPIQLITALSALANGGVLMKPYVIKGVVDRKGQIIREFHPTMVRKVISPATSKRITDIMTDVVGAEDGTGKRARIENVNVAGKTGTSQKFDHARHVYSSERVRTSFMGFFPAEAPQMAILVVLDEPQRDRWGGVASAPVFKNIGEQILNSYKPHIRERQPLEEKDIIPPRKEAVQLVAASPATAMNLPGATVEKDEEEAVMPDFRGLTIREALRKAKGKNIEVRVLGNGWAVSQHPLPGTPLAGVSSCTITFNSGK